VLGESSAEETPGEKKANRLSQEKSPYLLQHAYNPVDWYPWGEEAFKKARSEKKPIFLSIGYSTCHWCHVMERESFEDAEIATFLNENFVAIKVDREERPDVDDVYMSAVQKITGRGGWPLSVFLTPERKPFFGGTYFPPRDGVRSGMPGFLTVLRKVTDVWSTQREMIVGQAAKLSQAVAEGAKASATGAELNATVLDAGFRALAGSRDRQYGGFGRAPRFAPKFPRTSNLDFLMRYASTHPDVREEAMSMVHRTLEAMIAGGIHDHLAGGFHRYSVDRHWLIPHFEKMLYDQGLITRTLVDAYRISGREAYLDAAKGILRYLMERMTGPDGELYSAEDADTDHVEGKTYVWRLDEVVELLGPERGARFAAYYGVTANGNFEEGGEHVTVLHVADADLPARVAASESKGQTQPLTAADIQAQLAEDRARLLAVRDTRALPLRDDKVLTGWNGLGISAFALVYQVTGDERYLNSARRAASFLLEKGSQDGRLVRRYRQGEQLGLGFLEDYAFFVQGLLDLYEASFERRWLDEAVRLGTDMVELFWDSEAGGFFSSSQQHEALIVRSKEFYDGAVPSGNSVAFLNLLRLEEFTGSAEFRSKADSLAAVAAGVLAKSPQSYPRLLCAAFFRLQGAKEVVIIGPPGDPVTQPLLDEVRRVFLPAKIVVYVESDQQAEAFASVVPLLEGRKALGGKATGYVCRGGTCKLPAKDAATFKKQLSE